MKINVTQKEYRKLLELIYLGDWMLNAHVANPESETTHKAVRHNIYSHFRQMGCEHLIEAHKNAFFETREFEDTMQTVVEEYDDRTFWDELASRLAVRDAVNAVGLEKLKAMDGFERMELIGEMEERWLDELEAHGLERFTTNS